MVKLHRIILCMLVWALVSLPAGFSQDATEPVIKEASGEIVSVSVPDSTLVAKLSDSEGGQSFGDVTLLVNDETTITSEDSSLSVSDLKPKAKVEVVYEADASGKNTAKSIMVK
ncbi:MAG: hypothetical protein WC546_00595 [Candidatus Omnitrophota bacterium]